MDESHQQLLQTLKSVVEGLLNCQVANVWDIYGGLSRLHSILERILKHEFRIFKQNGEEDCWLFIQGLNWLQPSLATSPTPVSPNSPPPHPHTDKAMIWLHNSLETHSLSEKLAWLVSDEQHLASCYNSRAFLRQPRYIEASLVCLRAIEQNQLPLLAEIHPCLYLSERSLRAQEKFHRRCSSFPESIQRTMWSPKPLLDLKKAANTEMTDLSKKTSIPTKEIAEESRITEEQPEQSQPDKKEGVLYKIKPWRSLPDMFYEDVNINDNQPKGSFESSSRKSKTEPSSPVRHSEEKINPSMEKIVYSSLKNEKPFANKVKKNEKLQRNNSVSTSESCQDLNVKTSFIEDGGGRSILPMTTGSSFPKPEQGQSLTSFLSSKVFTQSHAELDRENAHFSICEAIIAAIEQVKCNKWEKMMYDGVEESDEEFKERKQRIRVRRRIKPDEKIGPISCSDTTTDQSFSPRSSDSLGGSNDSISTGVDDLEMDQVSSLNLHEMNKSGLSLSMASLYSEADLGGKIQKSTTGTCMSSPLSTSCTTLKSSTTLRSTSPETNQTNTAESVGLSLLSKFEDKQLPKASEIQWLISNGEVLSKKSSTLDTFVIDDDQMKNATALRGTENWAPPRPQIIFTTQPPPKRKEQMEKQNYLCAGCGMKVAPEYSHKFRYCNYLARYFCTGCHKNKQMLIPGRILSKWDFNKYPVSDFSYNLLEKMMDDPLFNVSDRNPDLYKRVKNLEKLRTLRLQLPLLKEFLFQCRYYTQESKDEFENLSGHLLRDCDTYSIVNFIQIKTGELLQKLNLIVIQSTNHVAKCQLCQGRGFMCEICPFKDVIYPWQLGKVSRCSKCGSCHHIICLRKAVSCPKCTRLAHRGLTVS
ncbi:run domain Beclin-1-interacting and cysteine-rich domain-containing protein [Cimex lectularius]|uniref:RUN domain-containing protein n=1 Tax=Cimex lectularius TaxID=79782 RepID=A0A8I6TG51_CIMLE|nr:run domain Beclin-1-interacting and cysteine-rich domain-containing protein [Cimex lectularius]XP_014248020.1 run domain Beclin-1-interacting and cysteine-rich domain-containing protein [Cimex lectularius]XP_014248021.1 run domain Beclin-1-interacting and cysteine-rich domain-containing protein [Cimex lectularius]